MTEVEWLERETPGMLLHEADSVLPASKRKLRLFAVICCQRVWNHFADGGSHSAIEVCEDVAEGRSVVGTLAAERAQIGGVGSFSPRASAFNCVGAVTARNAWFAASGAAHWGSVYFGQVATSDVDFAATTAQVFRQSEAEAARAEQKVQMTLLRDIFGNPFRPVTFSPEWRTSTVVALAQQMYDSRDFSAMPILADALQDAGCDHDDILNHCRDEKRPHVRGCWVVDLCLGKE